MAESGLESDDQRKAWIVAHSTTCQIKLPCRASSYKRRRRRLRARTARPRRCSCVFRSIICETVQCFMALQL